MRTSLVAMHGESTGIVSRMPDNTAAGYGPSYAFGREGAYICYIADCHWPNFYLIRASSFEEAHEHAVMCLCPIDPEAMDTAAEIMADQSMTDEQRFDAIETLAHENDGQTCPDGTIRTTWALQIHTIRGAGNGR